MRVFLLIIFTNILLFGIDSDFDGVDDRFDKCQNSKFTDIVDKNGCVVKSLASNHHFDMVFGITKIENDISNTTTKPIKIGYYYDSFSLSLSGSSYDYTSDLYQDVSGNSDYYLSGSYKIRVNKKLSISIGEALSIPTENEEENRVDYASFLSLSYKLARDYNLFGGATYTFVNDKNSDIASYKNTSSFYVGSGHYLNYKTYLSLFYSQSDSIYEGIDSTNTLYISGTYYLNKNWFGYLSYGKRINEDDPDTITSLKIGYYF